MKKQSKKFEKNEVLIFTNRSAQQHKFIGRKLDPVSLTVHGESFTVQELFNRAVAQGNLDQGSGTYLDVPIEEINHLYKQGIDLTDLDAHNSLIEELQGKLIDLAELQYQNEKESLRKAKTPKLKTKPDTETQEPDTNA